MANQCPCASKTCRLEAALVMDRSNVHFFESCQKCGILPPRHYFLDVLHLAQSLALARDAVHAALGLKDSARPESSQLPGRSWSWPYLIHQQETQALCQPLRDQLTGRNLLIYSKRGEADRK